MGLLKTTGLPRRPFMSQSSERPVSYQGGETGMRIISGATGAMMRLAKHPAPTLSRQARARLAWLDYYEGHERNASLTCRRVGISRTTFYRWRDRYNPRDLTCLEDRSSRPGRGRPRSCSLAEIEAVRALREAYPRWGTDKLAVLLSRQGLAGPLPRRPGAIGHGGAQARAGQHPQAVHRPGRGKPLRRAPPGRQGHG